MTILSEQTMDSATKEATVYTTGRSHMHSEETVHQQRNNPDRHQARLDARRASAVCVQADGPLGYKQDKKIKLQTQTSIQVHFHQRASAYSF